MERADPRTRARRLSRRTAILLGAGLSACARDAAPPSVRRFPTAVPAAPGTTRIASPASPDEAMAGIQETLQRQAAARAGGDKAAYMATVDQTDLTWRRIQGEVFDADTAAGTPQPTYTAARAQPKQDDYYKARIDVTPPGASSPTRYAVWIFRRVEAGWLLSEIPYTELGARKTLDTDHFQLNHFDWDDDVIEGTGRIAERAYAAVVQKLGTAPSFRAVVSVNPTYGAHSRLRGRDILAAYLPDTKNVILVRSPECFGAGQVPVGQSPEDHLRYPFTHEYTHLVNDQIVPVVKITQWMAEGLAEYVSGNFREAEVRQAFRSGRQVTIDKADEIIEWKTDPAKGYTAAQISLSYGEAAFAVAYFMERFGQEAFWQLARTYAESRRWPDSFAAATGITWDQFQAEWMRWLRQQLGV